MGVATQGQVLYGTERAGMQRIVEEQQSDKHEEGHIGRIHGILVCLARINNEKIAKSFFRGDPVS